MKKFKYPLHYPTLIPNLKEVIDLATPEEMETADYRIPILLVTQFGIHYNNPSDKIWIDKIVSENGEVALLYRGYLSNRQAGELRVVELTKTTNFQHLII
ncbi:MAG: hypothetical protein RL609_985 [Bacteroidota bacterium]|jgi:hypothetical protein